MLKIRQLGPDVKSESIGRNPLLQIVLLCRILLLQRSHENNHFKFRGDNCLVHKQTGQPADKLEQLKLCNNVAAPTATAQTSTRLENCKHNTKDVNTQPHLHNETPSKNLN